MFVLKESQQQAVDELFEYYLKFHNQNNKQPIYFQAPTGSGKTLILCALCNKIMEYSKKCIVLFVSISTGDIQEQNWNKASNYQQANNFNYYPYLISSPSRNNSKAKIDIINHIPLTNHYVYFMGSSTYTKASMFYTQQTFDSFIKEAKRQGYEIIYIRDEAHIGTRKTKDNDTKKLDQLLNDNANLTYYVSATLEQSHDVDVKIKEIDAVNDGLIKGNEILYKGVNRNESITSEQLLETALTEFKAIKKQYVDLGYHINPCLLIQIKNSKKEDKEKEQELIKSYKEAIDKHNLSYVVYTEDNKKESNTRHFNGKGSLTPHEKELITNNDSDIDVVIFKVALATGWDIPRANMLLQLREIYSDTLDIQTIGRIRRNPLAQKLNLDSPEKILDNYYIYSNVPKVKNDEYQFLKQNEEVIAFRNFQTVLLKEKTGNDQTWKANEFYDGLINYLKTESTFTSNPNKSKTFHEEIVNLNKQINETNQFSLQRSELYLDDEHKTKIPLVTEAINNVFTIDKYWKEKILFFNDNQFTKIINEFVNYYATKESLNPYVIKLYLLDFKNKQVFSHIVDQYNHLSDNTLYEYKLSPIFLLQKVTMECLTDVKKSNKLTLKDNLKKYLYWIPDEVNNDKDIDESIDDTVYSDSEGEKHFIKEMLDVLNREANSSSNKLHLYLLKNYLNNSNFRYEYIDKQPTTRKRAHYPDFVIEHNDNIYICEIKSENLDYDPKKTEELRKAYEAYSKLNNYHYLLFKYNQDSMSFSWAHWLNGKEINSDKPENNEGDLSKIFAAN